MCSSDDAVFGDRARLAEKLEGVKAERNQLLYQNQLLASDLKVAVDSVRGYCEERDTAEGRVEELEEENALLEEDLLVARCSLRNLNSLQAVTQTALDTARAQTSGGVR